MSPSTEALPCTFNTLLPTLIIAGSLSSAPCAWELLYSANSKSVTCLSPPEPPRVRLIPEVVSFERGVTTTLTCNIAGYYPLDVSVSWTQKSPKKAKIRLSNSRFSSHRQNRDGTYSITSYLSISSATAQAPATYSCRVSHMALEKPISVSAHLKAPGKCWSRGASSSSCLDFLPPHPPTTEIKTSETHHTCLFLPAFLLLSFPTYPLHPALPFPFHFLSFYFTP